MFYKIFDIAFIYMALGMIALIPTLMGMKVINPQMDTDIPRFIILQMVLIWPVSTMIILLGVIIVTTPKGFQKLGKWLDQPVSMDNILEKKTEPSIRIFEDDLW